MFKVIKIQKMDIYNPKITNGKTRQNEDDSFNMSCFSHFSIVTSKKKGPSLMINLYLLSLLKSIKTPSKATIYNLALHLSRYFNFCDSMNIDPFIMPNRKLKRPTYVFRMYLQDIIDSGERAASTCSTTMSAIIGFYRWLIHERRIEFKNKPWIEKNLYIKNTDKFGFVHITKVYSTNLAIKVNKMMQNSGKRIQDGGKLRPLLIHEQKAILQVLVELGNIEKLLIFRLAIETGARIGTICTLRKSCFERKILQCDIEIPVVIGEGTLVNNKFNKNMAIYIPRDLYLDVKTYLKSQRWAFRNSKTSTEHNSNDQYVFLTKFGRPYYAGKSDKNLHEYTHIPEGNGIRKFIKVQLQPKLKQLGFNFTFSFHDLRATFGLNLLFSYYPQFTDCSDSTIMALKIVQERLGHSSISTTEGYLSFRNHVIKKGVINNYITTKVDGIDDEK